MKKIIGVLGFVAIIIVIFAIGYGVYILEHKTQYYFGYESQVITTICETIEHKYLQQPDVCRR